MYTIEQIGEAAATTKRREWWGWFGSAVWLFFMMYGYSVFAYPDMGIAGGSWYPFAFMLLLALSIAAFGWFFGNNPGGLSRIASYMAPVALVLTAVFALLPFTLGSVLYAITPVFMAPAITRRVYGVIRTAGDGRQLTRYMSGLAVSVPLFAVWIIFGPPKEIAFLIPALLAVPVWIGVRRSVSLPEVLPAGGAFRISGRLIIIIAVALLILFWFNSMNGIIHTHIVNEGVESDNILITLLGFGLPAVGFLLYGVINDKGHERAGLICGMGLCIAGILIALMPDSLQEVSLLPLAFTDGLGGTYTEFLVIIFSVYFVRSSKRPIFAASLGLAVNLFFAVLNWISYIWLPEVFREFGPPALVSAAISAVVFVILAYLLFERYREKTLVAALFAFLKTKEPEKNVQESKEIAQAELQSEAMLAAGLTQQEKEVAALLMEGNTQYEISRKTHMLSGEVGKHINSIRKKIIGTDGPGELTAAIAREYSLTKRETDMLRYLLNNMGNDEIAAELFLSEETVKIHVRNLLRKLPVKSRADVREWMESYQLQK